MQDKSLGSNTEFTEGDGSGSNNTSLWASRYRETHRLIRVTEFPMGITPPKKVRIYRRRDYLQLQWWDTSEKKTLSERVDGDLVEAITRARRIDERLQCKLASGRRSSRVGHAELVKRFVADLEQRADAGEIDVATVARYRSALGHYLRFTEQPLVAKHYLRANNVDRDFRLAFDAFLNQTQVSSNGHQATESKPMRGQRFVLDVVRGMFQWSIDTDRGKLLPDDFRNPFTGRKRRTDEVAHDPIQCLDITMDMALELIMAADQFQLTIFAPLLLYGLRPGELGWLFREHQTAEWLHVSCLAELDYRTKGRRNKQFPLAACIAASGNKFGLQRTTGLLYVNRRVAENRIQPPSWSKSLALLSGEYRRRCKSQGTNSAAAQRSIRNGLMREAGQLNYDHVVTEFGKLARSLKWPAKATLKDLRHLCSTNLENAGVPEYFRKYFMGQSPGRAPLATYTHLTIDKLREQYQKAMDTELKPLAEAIGSRMGDAG
jgi:hypothetical protein